MMRSSSSQSVPEAAHFRRLQGHVGLVIMLLLEVHSFEYGRRLGALFVIWAFGYSSIY